jgi:hypothetical protein
LLRITGSADYDVQGFLSDIPDSDFVETSNQSLSKVGNLYDYMRLDSNGRSGFGSTAPKTSSMQGNPYAYLRSQLTEGPQSSRQGNPYDYLMGQSATMSGFAVVAGASSTPATGRGSPKTGKSKNGKTDPKGKSSNGPVKTVINIKTKDPLINANVDIKEIEKMPYMKQVINNFSAAESSRQLIERYHAFEMMPNSFEFSQLSSAWNEVARSGNYPLVDWSNYQLTKVSFSFLVVARQLLIGEEKDKDGKVVKNPQSIVNDGLLISIDEQLDNIRAMAGTPSPVTLYNLNNLLTTTYRYPYTNNAKNMQWIINDASITATRLTEGGKHISAAEVSLTLTEFPVIAREIIPLPPLTPDVPPPPPCKPNSGDVKCTPVVPQGLLWVNNNVFTFLEYQNTLVYPTGKPA